MPLVLVALGGCRPECHPHEPPRDEFERAGASCCRDHGCACAGGADLSRGSRLALSLAHARRACTRRCACTRQTPGRHNGATGEEGRGAVFGGSEGQRQEPLCVGWAVGVGPNRGSVISSTQVHSFQQETSVGGVRVASGGQSASVGGGRTTIVTGVNPSRDCES